MASDTEIESYRDLVVWRKALDLAVKCYRATEHFPRREIYGITAQIRRSAISVPTNIAEGKARWGAAEFRHHVSIANGSLAELETLWIGGEELGYTDAAVARDILGNSAVVRRMLVNLHQSLGGKR